MKKKKRAQTETRFLNEEDHDKLQLKNTITLFQNNSVLAAL